MIDLWCQLKRLEATENSKTVSPTFRSCRRLRSEAIFFLFAYISQTKLFRTFMNEKQIQLEIICYKNYFIYDWPLRSFEDVKGYRKQQVFFFQSISDFLMLLLTSY